MYKLYKSSLMYTSHIKKENTNEQHDLDFLLKILLFSACMKGQNMPAVLEADTNCTLMSKMRACWLA